MARRIAVVVLAVVLVVVFDAVLSYGQTPDHLKCYKVHDPLMLSGTVDLDSPQFGVDPGCKIARGVPPLFCVPATKTVVAVRDRATGQPITPLPISGNDPGDRLCYKLKCDAPSPPDQQVTDQFGTRTLSGLRAKLLCTPAVKGGPPTTSTTTTSTTSTTSTSSTTSSTTTTVTATSSTATTIGCTACSGTGPTCPGSGTPCTNDVNGFPCAAGVCDVNGQCCASRTFDVNGHCCDSAKCDVNGQCCASGAFDVNGHCCDSAKCDVNGQCCP